jgi:hypothetical protein
LGRSSGEAPELKLFRNVTKFFLGVFQRLAFMNFLHRINFLLCIFALFHLVENVRDVARFLTKLNDMAIRDDVHQYIPFVLAMGAQSVGKSSMLQRLLKIRLPIGDRVQ